MSKGLEMLMGSLKSLIPNTIWDGVENGIKHVVGKVDEMDARLARIEFLLDPEKRHATKLEVNNDAANSPTNGHG